VSLGLQELFSGLSIEACGDCWKHTTDTNYSTLFFLGFIRKQ